MKDRLRGFYAILDRDDRELAATLLEHASVLQVRMKPAARAEIEAACRWARELTREAGVLLVVNDDVELAAAVGADAVHLGQDDMPLEEALAAAPEGMLIGISTHDLDQVRAAVRGGADYLGFGPVFATSSKAAPDPAVGLDGLRAAVREAGEVPVVAIGGITPSRAAAIHATGAAAVCAIASVNRAEDVRGAARALAAPWRR